MFEEAQRTKTTRPFWPIVYAEFFESYPNPQSEMAELKVEEAEEERTKEAEVNQAKAKGENQGSSTKQAAWPTFATVEEWKDAREKQIHAWFYNAKIAGRTAPPKVQVVVAPPPPQARTLSEVNVYSKMFYEKRVKAKVDAEKLKEPGAPAVAIMNRVLRASYKEESDEVKEAVREERDRLLQKRKDNAEVIASALDEADDLDFDSPARIAQFLGVLKEVMNSFFEPIERKTGWVWTVIGAGPDPRKPTGQITTKSFHYGETPTGQNFFEWHPMFNQVYMNPLSSFAHQVFPESIRQQRALDQQGLVSFRAALGDVPDMEPVFEPAASATATPTPSTSDGTSEFNAPSSSNLRPSIAEQSQDSTIQEQPQPMTNPALELFKALPSVQQAGSAFDEMRSLLEQGIQGGPSEGSIQLMDPPRVQDSDMGGDFALFGFNQSGHPASLAPEAGTLGSELSRSGWLDYRDATQNVYLQDSHSLPGNDIGFNQPQFPPANTPYEYLLPTPPSPILNAVIQPQTGHPSGSGVRGTEGNVTLGSVVTAKRAKQTKRRGDGLASAKAPASKRARKVNQRQEMSDWMWGAKKYLEGGSVDPRWVECIERWWAWEERFAVLASTNTRLPGNACRPPLVTKWNQKKVFSTPVIDLEAFAKEWEAWWEVIKASGNAAMKKPGQTGLVIVLISLMWWKSAGEEERWENVVDELSSIFERWLE
ncbi:hypothetical protein BKA70DRAFT_1231193 [Coprinopsis sp. MPI-PUGE-AT-0042]|nr:hypothetical protein BKA70DRAFT_1231193 [Coprinopsis sp. MPI-PUGE-AT-0042]